MNEHTFPAANGVDAYISTPSERVAVELRQEYEQQHNLFQAQPQLTQRFLEAQARQIVEAVVNNQPQVQFTLPDKVICPSDGKDKGKTLHIPPDERSQLAGGLIDRLTRTGLSNALHQRLSDLEQSANPAVSCSARLTRHAIVLHMVYGMLPSGRSVQYLAEEGEEIPTIPVAGDLEAESAITAKTDAIVEDSDKDEGRGELIVPYVPAARRFYLPQWVAFDDQYRLLVGSINEAETYIASMQRFLNILNTALSLAAYIAADEEYQRKRYGMLGQLVNQGRCLANYIVGEIIETIKQRATAEKLNRGLSLSLPYFDDQYLEMKTHDFEIIPSGRIMFVSAFVVRAARREQVIVGQDIRLSPSTRKHLLSNLKRLEKAFEDWKPLRQMLKK